jgi:hypothetical protein
MFVYSVGLFVAEVQVCSCVFVVVFFQALFGGQVPET